jgi:hypothetical protein
MSSAFGNRICRSLDEESGGCSSAEFVLHYGGSRDEATATVPDEVFGLPRPLRGPFTAVQRVEATPTVPLPSDCTVDIHAVGERQQATMGSPLGKCAAPGHKICPSDAK